MPSPAYFFALIQRQFVFLSRVHIWFDFIHVSRMFFNWKQHTKRTHVEIPPTPGSHSPFALPLASSQPRSIRMSYRFLLYTMVGICQDAPSSTIVRLWLKSWHFVVTQFVGLTNQPFHYDQLEHPGVTDRCLWVCASPWCHQPCDTQNSSP